MEVVWHFGGMLQDLRRGRAGDLGRPSMGEDDLYNGLCFVGSASGNGAQASPRETTRGPSVEGCREVFAKLPLYGRSLQTRCTCPKIVLLHRATFM
jgi:hypothetical protein